MSTSTSDSYHYTDSESSIASFDTKIESLENLIKKFSTEIENSDLLLQSLKVYKKNHLKRDLEMRKKIEALGNSFGHIQDENKGICEARFAKVTHILKPYLRDTQQITPEDGDLKERMDRCLTKVCGLENGMKSTENISKKVMNDYVMLGVIEKKQKDAIQRFENVSRAENLAFDIPSTDHRYSLVHTPGLLLALSICPDVSGYYQKRIHGLQQRMSSLVAQIRFNSKEIGLNTVPEYSEELQNGEIHIQSLIDKAEAPLENVPTN